jgi:hypothetical protein
MMILPQNSPRISRLKREGIERRRKLIEDLPEEFTSKDVAEKNGITQDAANAQIRKMIIWSEIESTSSYKTPRVYRKIKNA